jgi:trehalose 6-phosphate phosphatase
MKRTFWIFDFDGTLSPIVADRNAAKMHPECHNMLKELIKVASHSVVVLSSRMLDDIIQRIDVPGIYIGGNNGLRWYLPRHRVLDCTNFFTGHLRKTRRSMIRRIMALKELPGIDIEDKEWSVAVHLRKMTAEAKQEAVKRIHAWDNLDGIRILRGPEALEIIFSSFFNKSVGIQVICKHLKFSPENDTIIYAGDDENDTLAMAHVMSTGGTAITVGSRTLLRDTYLVENPEALARLCRKMAGLLPDEVMKNNSLSN